MVSGVVSSHGQGRPPDYDFGEVLGAVKALRWKDQDRGESHQ